MACNFNQAHYREIIDAFLSAGYQFIGYNNLIPRQPYQIILRHDIDLSLDDALRIAHIDAEMGVRSTFHFLLTAQVYNLLSAAGQSTLAAIRNLEHNLGLHIDPIQIDEGHSASPSFYPSLQKLFHLAEIIMGPLDSYSLHRPTATGKMEDLAPEQIPFPVPAYAYSPIYREQLIYRSDSRREWRHGCICQQIRELSGQSLQLLLHPIWWTPEPQTRQQVLQQYLQRQRSLADDYLVTNLSFYRREKTHSDSP